MATLAELAFFLVFRWVWATCWLEKCRKGFDSTMSEARQEESRLVIHVVPSLDFGGVEKRMELIAKYSVHSRLKHVFVALGQGGYSETKIREHGGEVYCLNGSVSIPSFRSIIRLYLFFKRHSPDIVHMHNVSANFHGIIGAWIQGVPVRIAEVVGAGPHSYKVRLLFRWVYKMANKVIGVSKASSRNLIQMGEIPEEKSVSLYNPVELPDRSVEKVAPSDKFRICSVGRLEKVKNYESLIAAVDILRNKDISCELWIVGDGTQRFMLEKEVASRGLSKVVKFLGYQRKPGRLVQQCHVYVQPSHAEAFGIALVEAMGVSTPVIVTRVGAGPEIVQDGQTGWLLPGGSPEEIASALQTAWRCGPERLSEMGQSAQQSVLDRFHPEAYVQSLDELYFSELLKKKRLA